MTENIMFEVGNLTYKIRKKNGMKMLYFWTPFVFLTLL